MNDSQAYKWAHTQGAIYLWPQAGYLRLSDADQKAFLQRQTSNDINLLQSNQAVLTALTSPTGRILDVFYLLQEENAIGVLTLPDRFEATFRYLRSRIFFMDRVGLNDESAAYAQIDLIGPAAAFILSQTGLKAPSEANQVIESVFGASRLRLLKMDPGFAPGIRLLAPVETSALLIDALIQAGAARLDTETYQVFRIELGAPGAQAELTEEFTPFEAGLGFAVSANKGCYSGQEVLARQVTYDKITQRLVGLKLDSGASPGGRLWSTTGKPAGKMTSWAESPRHGRIGLGIVKRPYDEVGESLICGEVADVTPNVCIVPLPFQ